MSEKIYYRDKISFTVFSIPWAFLDPSENLSNKDFTILKAKELIKKFSFNLLNDNEIEQFAWNFLSDALCGFLLSKYELLIRSPTRKDYRTILPKLACNAHRIQEKFSETRQLANIFLDELKILDGYGESYKTIPNQLREELKHICIYDLSGQGFIFTKFITLVEELLKNLDTTVKNRRTKPTQVLDEFLSLMPAYYEKYSQKKAIENFSSRDNEYSGNFYDFCFEITQMFLEFRIKLISSDFHKSIKASMNSSGFGKKIQKIITNLKKER